MGYIICSIIFFWVGWRLGRKYQDFEDIMMARRIAKLIEQREQIGKERTDFDRWEKQDKRMGKILTTEVDPRD